MARFDSRQILKDLEEAGWFVARTRGSHVQLKHPDNPLLVTLPHPKRDLPQGTAAAIYRAAGIIPPWKAARKNKKS